MKIAVLGASGQTGSVVLRQLHDAGRPVRALVRRPDTARRLMAAGHEAMVLDLARSSAEQLTAGLAGCDAVINAAAGRTLSGWQARKVDRDGIIRAIGAAQAAGVRRWVQISMMGSDDPRRIPLFLRRVAAMKGAADEFLAGSDLTWTVVRPPWLTDGPGSGHLTVARNLEGGSLRRSDLAAVAIACLGEKATERTVFDVCTGVVPLRTALAGAADLE